MSFNERSHRLATLAVEIVGRLGVEGRNLIDPLAASVVGGGMQGSMTSKEVLKEHLNQIKSSR